MGPTPNAIIKWAGRASYLGLWDSLDEMNKHRLRYYSRRERWKRLKHMGAPSVLMKENRKLMMQDRRRITDIYFKSMRNEIAGLNTPNT